MNSWARPLALSFSSILFLAGLASAQEPAWTGPETEKRFPPLKLPPQFKATLFACDPLIEYPSVLALGPRSNSVFLAHDYMTGLGEKIVRRDEVRLVEDTDGDGYADKSGVWAGDFNSIQGLAYRNGTVFVMHSPLLTVLRDTNGDGRADERRDALNGLGWPPEKSIDRLHGANGVVAGHDGWLYLALGDRGCDVARPEGDRFVLHGGGILRCRPDGNDLHLFSTGLRNIYDVALDHELNVFVRDNENDGGDYLIRVCHSFMGADHGYPYLYREHADEALAPLADLGRGSSAGGVAYLEPAFPATFHETLFFCEWGKSIVLYPRERKGAGFATMKETEFATGAPDDPYGFRPTDVIVDRDGSLLVTDWADGQRPKRGRGRIYRIQYAGEKSQPARGLNSESYFARLEAQAQLEERGPDGLRELQFDALTTLGRLHAVWLFARLDERTRLFEIAERDPDISVRVQAVRAIADLSDPILLKHRLEAEGGDPEIARRLAALAALGGSQDPRMLFEVIVALGRLRWSQSAPWLGANLRTPDPTCAHAAVQALRRSRNWPAVLEWLDPSGSPSLRPIALRALAEQAQIEVADGLIHRLETAPEPAHRREYVELLARVYKKPGPWVYWGFRPEPRLPNTEAWERTTHIQTALERTLADPDRDLRLVALQKMEREKIPFRPENLIRWLGEEQKPDRVAAILSSLSRAPAETVRDAVEAIVRERAHTITNRLAALQILVRALRESPEGRLLELAATLEESAVLAETLRQLARTEGRHSVALLVGKLRAPTSSVRIAAINALAELGAKKARWPAQTLTEAQASLTGLLNDPEPTVRAAAASALGKLRLTESATQLVACAADVDGLVRRRSLEALTELRDPRAVQPALRALERDDLELLTALRCLAEVGGPAQGEDVTRAAMRNRSIEILQTAARILLQWERAFDLACLQGASGVMLGWKVSDPLRKEEAEQIAASLGERSASIPRRWRAVDTTNSDARVHIGSETNDTVRIAVAELIVPETSRAAFRLSSNGTLDAWVNGKLVHHRAETGRYATDSDRFEADLETGLNRMVLRIAAAGPTQWHARFRRKSATARHERLSDLALATRGNSTRGRELFFNAERTACIKCHRLENQGGGLGPDLTGVGRRFSRIHLIESILEPSRAIASAYRNLSVRLSDGTELTGVPVMESDAVLALGDAQGQTHELRKDQITERRTLELSIMPEGLEAGLTDEEFADLVAFLAERK